jgi:hypothetical protein
VDSVLSREFRLEELRGSFEKCEIQEKQPDLKEFTLSSLRILAIEQKIGL